MVDTDLQGITLRKTYRPFVHDEVTFTQKLNNMCTIGSIWRIVTT